MISLLNHIIAMIVYKSAASYIMTQMRQLVYAKINHYVNIIQSISAF
jgi:hypothetical protein